VKVPHTANITNASPKARFTTFDPRLTQGVDVQDQYLIELLAGSAFQICINQSLIN